PAGSFKHLTKYPVVAGLGASRVLVYLASHAVQSNWRFFTMFRFKWTSVEVGYSLGFVGLLVMLVQGGLIRVVIPKLGQKRSVFLGMILYSVGLFLLAFATQSWMMYAFLVPYCLGGIAGPALQGIISSQVPPNEQGELQGALTSLVSVTSIIGPLLMNQLFAAFTSSRAPFYFPGVSFFTGAVFTVISTLLAVRSLKHFHNRPH
ncbi:MAG: MFS transporter, partial [Bacteroidia bacterium]|nr:MFS transporter [Bacteroidia bacterium]